MKWTKIRIQTTTEAEDVIISTLYDIGLEGAQIEDNVPLTAYEKESMFVDILPESGVDDGIAYLSFFVEQEEDGVSNVDELLPRIEEELEELRVFMDIGTGAIEVSETEDIDWINNWKEFFHQFYIDDLLVIPSWEEVKEEDADKKILHIDPGTAFGTGMHHTTQLCIRQITKYVTPRTRLLDVGCGSGILGIVALMYGACYVMGTDLDPCALAATSENKKANDIHEDDLEVIIGNLIDSKEVQDRVGDECYDMVVANILADVLVPITPLVVHHMKKGAYYITSGIIDDKEATVREAVEAAGLEVVEVTYQGEWVSITARKWEK
ncbi:MAG: 50S ribosomal protein L11 methyltransferase [Eubacteriales bacterium]